MNPAVPQSRAIAPVAFEDGLGERLYAVGAANEPLEVLKISSELSCVSTFEDGVREQAARLADFRHEAFSRVRAVERLDSRASTLVIISDHVRGVRLSEVLAGARKRSIPLEYSGATWLIRQLVSAIAALHDSGPGVCHGAISPERLVVTPDGRLVVVEYVLGPSLEEMHFSWERYWRELGIALPRPIGLSRFDQSADVTQMAAVALALLLGRPLAADEYPHKISDILDSATARQIEGSDPLPAALRTWLRRALHIEPRAAFASAIEAQTELDRVLDTQDTAGRLALRSFLSRYAAAIALERQMAAQTKPESAPVEAPTAQVAVETAAVAPVPPLPVPVAPMAAPPLPQPEPLVASVASVPDVFAAPQAIAAHRDEEDETAEVPETPLFGASPSTAAISDDDAEANDDDAAFGPPSSVTPFPAPAPFVPLPSPSLGVASVTPFTPRAAAAELRLPVPESGPWANPGPDTKSSAALASKESDMPRIDLPQYEPEPIQPAARAVSVKGGRPVWQSPWAAAAVLALIAITTGVTLMGRKPAVPAATATGSGTLEIGTNPDGVAVFIDGANRGNTPLTISLAAGAHVVELVTETDRRKVPVTMKAGTHMSHFIEMPKTPAGVGDLQVRTDPSRATVSVDGRVVGRTPFTVKGLTAGTHRVVLENESGSFSDDVVIEAGAVASLVVPMTKPASGANVSGWISISAPADLQVYEGGRLVGSSRSDRIMVAVGRHELEMVNETLGYRSTRTVDVGPGQVATVRPEWPKGSMALNALPWAEVSVDGERVGETPIGSVQVPIGTHEIIFRHPELGERRTTATVTTGASTRVSMDMRAK
ncbi:MAG TPA: PEGA domain-containing protein [Vicinamibacterales bacterium]|nr:PEGA domain-containing protein [Vicinamibacterales bacterium]